MRKIARAIVEAAFLPFAVTVCLLARLGRRREKPVVVFGPTPIINIKYWAKGLSGLGYKAVTIVGAIYPINVREDFGVVYGELKPGWMPAAVFRALAPYYAFIGAVWSCDVFVHYFHGGFLQGTLGECVEPHLLKLAGKKTILTQYGTDCLLPEKMPEGFRAAIEKEYPAIAAETELVKKRLNRWARHADFILDGGLPEYLPRYDATLMNSTAVDVSLWTAEPPSPAGTMRILHTANHPATKGSQILIDAVDKLKEEGADVELVYLTKAPNEKVREEMARCDVVADQFLMGRYGLFAIEGMARAKPVVGYIDEKAVSLYAETGYGAECPIINTPPDRLLENLRRLASNRGELAELGRRGRAYVEKYHSTEFLGGVFDLIIRRIWSGEKVDIPGEDGYTWPERGK